MHTATEATAECDVNIILIRAAVLLLDKQGIKTNPSYYGITSPLQTLLIEH